jgi:hypothetical protein
MFTLSLIDAGGRGQRMTESKEYDSALISERNLRRCPSCAAIAPVFRTLLDPVSGRTIGLLECQCGERTWNEIPPAASGRAAK